MITHIHVQLIQVCNTLYICTMIPLVTRRKIFHLGTDTVLPCAQVPPPTRESRTKRVVSRGTARPLTVNFFKTTVHLKDSLGSIAIYAGSNVGIILGVLS